MKISLFQLILLIVLFLMLFRWNPRIILGYFQSGYQFSKKNKKDSSTRKKIDN